MFYSTVHINTAVTAPPTKHQYSTQTLRFIRDEVETTISFYIDIQINCTTLKKKADSEQDTRKETEMIE